MKQIKKLANSGSHRAFLPDNPKEKKPAAKDTTQAQHQNSKTKSYVKAHDILKKVDQRNSIDSECLKQLELKARASDPKKSASQMQRDIAMVKKLDSKLN